MSEALTQFLLHNPQTTQTNYAIGALFGVSEATVRRRKRKLRWPANGLAPNPDPLASPTATSPDPTTSPNLEVSGDANQLDFKGLTTDNPLDPTDATDGAFGKIFELAGVDPKQFELVADSFRFTTWQQSKALADGSRDLVQLYSYRGSFRKLTPDDLEAKEAADLLRLAQSRVLEPEPYIPDHYSLDDPSPVPLSAQFARIVVAGDMQIGKVDYRGGTEELLERVAEKTQALQKVMQAQPTELAYLFDPGDLTEGFENVSSQKFLNDLSLPSMLRVGRAVLTDLVSVIAGCAEETTVVAVPSNHGAWRSGKGYLGKPGDDFGLEVHHAVGEVFAHLPELDVSWVVPDVWDESVAVQVGSSTVGLVHGHQARPGKFIDWWRGQALGSGPVADAHICISGHYHNTLFQTAGYLDGRERVHIQSPPMDNGSSWWRNLTGEQSSPGIVTFLLNLDSGDITDFRVV